MLTASWNMHRNARNWSVLPNAPYDLVLLQEAPPPPGGLDGYTVFEALEPRRGTSHWGRRSGRGGL